MKKKLIIVSCLVMCLVFGTVPVFAAEEPYTFDMWCADNELSLDVSSNDTWGEDYAFSYDENCFYIARNSSIGFCVYKVTDVGQFFYRDGSKVYAYSSVSCSLSYKLYIYDSDGWRYSSGGNPSVSAGSSKEVVDFFSDEYPIIYSNVDIYSDVNKTDVFFQRTPLPQITLSEIVEEANPKIMMAELIGVLPLVIGLVVCCLGLRKGWNLLAAALHKA